MREEPKKRKFVATEEELDELILLRKDSADDLVTKIQDRGELVEEQWIMADTRDGDLGGFLASQLRHDSLATGCLRLNQRLWGDPKEVDTIYISDWCKQTATEIVKNYMELSPCIVAGSSGMGKSVFGLVLLMQAVDAGFRVAYQKGTKRFWIVGDRTCRGLYETYYPDGRGGDDSDREDGRGGDEGDDEDDIIERKLKNYRFSSILKPGVYKVKSDVELFDELTHLRKVVHIVDIDDSVQCEINPFGRKVIISSPNSSKLMRIGEFHNPTYKYMPLWTLEELQALNDYKVSGEGDIVVVPNPIYHKVTAEVLKELYEKFGGVPRVIFKNESVGKKYRTLQETIQETPLEVLRTALGSHSYSRLSNAIPSLLLHVKEDPNHPEDCRAEFVSEYVMTAVADYHGLQSPEEFFPSHHRGGEGFCTHSGKTVVVPEDKNVDLELV